jgi:ATP-dependent helicase HepA
VSELARTPPTGDGAAAGALDDLVRETRDAREDLAERVERGRDRLLELASLRRDVADRLIAEIEARDADRTVERFALSLFEHFHVYA